MESAFKAANSVYLQKSNHKPPKGSISPNKQLFRSLSIKKTLKPEEPKKLKRQSFLAVSKNLDSLPTLKISDVSKENKKVNEEVKGKNVANALLQKMKSRIFQVSHKNHIKRDVLFILTQALEEIAAHFEPLSEIILEIKQGIVNYCRENEIDSNFRRLFEEIENKNKELVKNIEHLNKEKQSLVKKLNKSEDEIEKMTKEHEKNKEYILSLEKKLKIGEDHYLDPEKVLENALKQTNTIQKQKEKIKELMFNEIKLKKIIDYAESKGFDIEEIIQTVNSDFFSASPPKKYRQLSP